MISASISLLLGVLGWVAITPPLLPVIGLALGLNAVLKSRKEQAGSAALWLGSVGALVSGSAVAVALASRYA